MHGPWEFFRKDGVIMCSGSFDHGEQVGEWTTYDKAGNVYKVTTIKPKPAKAPVRPPAKPAKSAKTAKLAAPKPQPSADDLFAALDHPLKADIGAVRKAVLSIDKSINDGVKWNSLSFRTTDWFATVNLRSRDQVQLVLHLGAKTGKAVTPGEIADPKGLLDWRSADRAIASLGAGMALKANLPALKSILKAWVTHV